MNWLHPGFLLALTLVLVPVALHLMLRAKPKPLPFPALRLIQNRRTMNRRRMRLRHWSLLLLRMLVIASIVLALARPTLPPANYAPTWRESLMFGGILAVAAVAFVGLSAWLKRQNLARHVRLTRQTTFRMGWGAATLLAFLLLVVWPYQSRIAAEISAPVPPATADVPVAAVFILDVGRRMEYRHEGQTRLEVSIALIREQLERLPTGSRATIIHANRESPGVLSSDLTAVIDQVQSVAATDVPHKLNEQLQAAIRLHQEDRERTLQDQASVPEPQRQDRFAREIYLLTDLARSAWRMGGEGSLRQHLEELDWLALYLVDVGVERPVNTGLSSLQLSRSSVPEGSPVRIDATLSQLGRSADESAIVELRIAGPDGRLAKVGQTEVTATDAGTAAVSFDVPAGKPPFQTGELRVVGIDPLEADNVLAFTFGVHPPPQVLLVAESDSQSRVFRKAIAPDELVRANRARYRVTTTTPAQLSRTNLESFSAIVVLQASQPDEAFWTKLHQFAEAGGGVMVCAGRNSSLAAGSPGGLNPIAYNTPTAQILLPARLKASLKFSTPATLDWTAVAHPVVQRLEQLEAFAEFSTLEIRRYWSVEPVAESLVVASYTNESQLPAILERPVGRGRCVLVTTALNSVDWNDLERSWVYVAMADLYLQVLSRESADNRNFLIGQDLSLSFSPANNKRDFLLRQPDFRQLPYSLPADASELRIKDLAVVGLYDLVPVMGNAEDRRVFTMNHTPEACDLTRLSSDELNGLLGANRYSVDRDLNSLERRLAVGRLGQEVYGLLVSLLILFFAAEQVTATWFYRVEEVAV